MSIKICASFGKQKLGGFEEKPNLEMIDFSNIIHCKYCQVNQIKDETYEISCNKQYVKIDESKVKDGENLEMLINKVDQLNALLESGFKIKGDKLIIPGREMELSIPDGVEIGTHSPQYLIKFMPSIGEYLYPSECWDYEERKDSVKLIPQDGIVKLLFKHPSGRTQVWIVDPNSKNIRGMYKFLENESINF